MMNRQEHYEEENRAVQPKFLTELIPTSIDAENHCYLQPLVRQHDDLYMTKASFKSEDIVDSWKYAQNRSWYHPLHRLSPYLGRFPPALARYFIYKFSREKQVVYDPFCGSGTVPLEACILDRESFGSDVFTYAFTLSHAKVRPLPRSELYAFLHILHSEVQRHIGQTHLDEDPLLQDLLVYYHPTTLKQIITARTILQELEHHDDYIDAILFVKAMICGILHGDTATYLSIQTKDTWSASVRYVQEYVAKHQLEYEPRDLFTSLEKKAQRIYTSPLPPRKGTIYEASISGRLPSEDISIADESVDLIITSPPYLSVRNYALDNWIRVWFLGSSPRAEAGKMLRTSVAANYEVEMKIALQQMFRVLKWDRPCIIVAGDVNKGKQGKVYHTTFRLAELAREIGFTEIAIFDDGINFNRRTSQLFNKLYHPNMIDSVPHDSILILSKGRCPIYDGVPVSYTLDSSQ